MGGRGIGKVKRERAVGEEERMRREIQRELKRLKDG